jgi:AAA domain, putative AbiEii toxin, Type IV TA system
VWLCASSTLAQGASSTGGSCQQGPWSLHLERLDLQPGPDEPIESLSKGNRQKLVLAQAFLSPVGLLVLDEPFSGLDPVAHAALGELTNEAQSGGTAVLVSSHHAFSEQAGLHQLRIRDGRLAEIHPDEDPRSAGVRTVEVELLSTEKALDRRGGAAAPSVLSGVFMLVLRVESLRVVRPAPSIRHGGRVPVRPPCQPFTPACRRGTLRFARRQCASLLRSPW